MGWIIFSTFAPMTEQVNDISGTLRGMASEMRSMRETIDSQYREICQLNCNLDALRIELRKCKDALEEKDKRISELMGKPSKYETPEKNKSLIKI